MKTFILFLLVLPHVLSAQNHSDAFIKYFNKDVNVYQYPIGDYIKFKVFQDSINETNYYNVVFLQNSPLRFKVRIQAYDTSPFLEGWVDKDCIAVYPRYSLDEKGNNYFIIYDQPLLKSGSRRVYEKIDSTLTVVDYNENWVKVIFMIDGVLHTGWTNHFCTNIYNSCT